MSKKEPKRNHILSIIIAFLLSVFLTLICVLAGTYFGLLNKALLSDAMNKSSYYESVNAYTLEEASDLAIPLGLDDSVFNNVFTLQNTYTEGKALLDANLNGQGYSVDTTDIQNQLADNIRTYAENHHVILSETQRENIDYFTSQVRTVYIQNLTVPFMNYYAGIRKMFQQIVIIAIPVLMILSALCMFLLCKLHRWFHKGLRYIAYAFTASAMMSSLLPLYLLLSKRYMKLNITPAYFYKLITHYINQSLMMYLYVALVMLAIALFIIAAIYNIRKKIMRS